MKNLSNDDVVEAAHRLVAKWEGGLTDHPADPGGITNYGISLTFLKQIDPMATADDIRALTADDAKRFMRREFWDKPGTNRFPPLIGVAFYDLAVNAGCRRSTLLMQEALDVAADGIIGPVTLAVLTACDQKAVALRMLDLRKQWYRRLVVKKPTSRVFLKGWLNRTADCRKLILRLADEWEVA